jgi:hypothetical protein
VADLYRPFGIAVLLKVLVEDLLDRNHLGFHKALRDFSQARRTKTVRETACFRRQWDRKVRLRTSSYFDQFVNTRIPSRNVRRQVVARAYRRAALFGNGISNHQSLNRFSAGAQYFLVQARVAQMVLDLERVPTFIARPIDAGMPKHVRAAPTD